MVQDINRPDINGVPPKMQSIADLVNAIPTKTPHFVVGVDDNLLSNVTIWGALDTKDQWYNGIFYNGKYFIVSIFPKTGRYYNPGDNVTLSLTSSRVGKLRKYTSSPEKVVKKLGEWLSNLK
jgi:hypothetical protein